MRILWRYCASNARNFAYHITYNYIAHNKSVCVYIKFGYLSKNTEHLKYYSKPCGVPEYYYYVPDKPNKL